MSRVVFLQVSEEVRPLQQIFKALHTIDVLELLGDRLKLLDLLISRAGLLLIFLVVQLLF